MDYLSPLHLAVFALAWAAVIYLYHSAFARTFKRIQLLPALLYITTVALIGVFGEVLVDTIYNAVVGRPLWEYRVLPIHDGYTSIFSPVVWGLYGFYLYLLHDNLSARSIRSGKTLVVFIALEAMFLEILLNITFIALFDSYIFYYLPGELWHLTSIQVVPFYFIAGVVIVRAVRACASEPKLFIAMHTILLFVLVGLLG